MFQLAFSYEKQKHEKIKLCSPISVAVAEAVTVVEKSQEFTAFWFSDFPWWIFNENVFVLFEKSISSWDGDEEANGLKSRNSKFQFWFLLSWIFNWIFWVIKMLSSFPLSAIIYYFIRAPRRINGSASSLLKVS